MATAVDCVAYIRIILYLIRNSKNGESRDKEEFSNALANCLHLSIYDRELVARYLVTMELLGILNFDSALGSGMLSIHLNRDHPFCQQTFLRHGVEKDGLVARVMTRGDPTLQRLADVSTKSVPYVPLNSNDLGQCREITPSSGFNQAVRERQLSDLREGQVSKGQSRDERIEMIGQQILKHLAANGPVKDGKGSATKVLRQAIGVESESEMSTAMIRLISDNRMAVTGNMTRRYEIALVESTFSDKEDSENAQGAGLGDEEGGGIQPNESSATGEGKDDVSIVPQSYQGDDGRKVSAAKEGGNGHGSPVTGLETLTAARPLNSGEQSELDGFKFDPSSIIARFDSDITALNVEEAELRAQLAVIEEKRDAICAHLALYQDARDGLEIAKNSLSKFLVMVKAG